MQTAPSIPRWSPIQVLIGTTLIEFSDRTRTGMFNVIWPLARIIANVYVYIVNTYTFLVLIALNIFNIYNITN